MARLSKDDFPLPPVIEKNKTLIIGAIAAACVLGFYFTRSSMFSALGFVAIVLLFFSDFSSGSGKTDWKKSAIDLGQALALAVIVWWSLQFVLQTNAPLDVVTSCSMLPNLERGDLIIVQGGAISAPKIQFAGELSKAIYALGAQTAPCNVTVSGATVASRCTNAVVLEGKAYPLNPSNDIIVFEPQPRDYGLIVHRAAVIVTNGTHEFLLTKGDNNQQLDQQAGFAPVPPQDVKGKVLLRVPLVGFLKLFLFLQLEEPKGCKMLVQAGA